MIFIGIPVHNEERVVGVLLWKIRKVMAEFGRDYEIVMVDDASTDGTADALARYAELLPLTVLESRSRLGYAGASERLLRHVVATSQYPKRDVIVTLQGDFTESPDDLVPMVKAIEGGVDLVAGVPGDGVEGLPRAPRLLRRLAPVLLGSAHAGAPVSDPLAGYRAYRVVVVKKAMRDLAEGNPLLTAESWAANLQLLSLLVPHARRIEESPFRLLLAHRERDSRFRFLPTLRNLLRVRRTTWAAASLS